MHDGNEIKKISRKEELLKYLKASSPRQILMDVAGGAQPAKTDLQLIEDIMFKHMFPPEVMNVLIQFVLLKKDMQLPKNYIESIAAHWSREKIKTAEEAMDIAKSSQAK